MAKKKTVFAKTHKNGHKYSRRPHRKGETLIVRQSKVRAALTLLGSRHRWGQAGYRFFLVSNLFRPLKCFS